MTVQQVQKALQHRNLKKVADATDIKYDVVWRIANGKVKNPSYDNITALIRYLEQY